MKDEEGKEIEASDEKTSKEYDLWIEFAERNAERLGKGNAVVYKAVFKDILCRYKDQNLMEWNKKLSTDK